MDDFLIRNVRIADGSKKLYKQGKSGLNLCAFTAEAAMYSEFMQHIFYKTDYFNLEHLRRICKEKTERYDYFLQAVEDYYIMDDEISINEEIHEDGSVEIRKIVCGVEFDKPWISIDPDGAIENAGRLKYVQVMKDHGVEIVFENTK